LAPCCFQAQFCFSSPKYDESNLSSTRLAMPDTATSSCGDVNSGASDETSSAAVRLDNLLGRMEGFAQELSGGNRKRGAVRSRTTQIELERCMDDTRTVLHELLDPAERTNVVQSFTRASGAKRAARLEVFLKVDSNADGLDADEPESPTGEEACSPRFRRNTSTIESYSRKVRAVRGAYGAIKGVLDAKSQRLIEREVVSLEKEKIKQEESLQAEPDLPSRQTSDQGSGNTAAADNGILRAHYEALRCLNDALVQELENYRTENERLRSRVNELERQDVDPSADADNAKALDARAGQHVGKSDIEVFEQKTDASSRPATQDLDSDRESEHGTNRSSGTASEPMFPSTVSGLSLMSPYGRWAHRLSQQ